MSVNTTPASRVISELLALGHKQIQASEECGLIIEVFKELGVDVALKTKANALLASNREALLGLIDKQANEYKVQAVGIIKDEMGSIVTSLTQQVEKESKLRAKHEIEMMKPEIATQTAFQLYCDGDKRARMLMLPLVLMCCIVTAVVMVAAFQTEPFDTELLMVALLVPFASLVAIIAVPVKSVAYTAINIAAKVADSKIEKALKTKKA